MRKSNFIYPMIGILVALLSFPAIVCAQDAAQVQTQLATTYYRPVPVQVINTPLPTKVISEPATTRNVNVVSEPATPRDVNVLNTVIVSANEPLPVSMQQSGPSPDDYVSVQTEIYGDTLVLLYVVPADKHFILTDLYGDPFQSVADMDINIIVQNERKAHFQISDVSTNHTTRLFSFNTGFVFEPGTNIYVKSAANQGGRIAITGKLVS